MHEKKLQYEKTGKERTKPGLIGAGEKGGD